MNTAHLPHIVIIGAGFAGLEIARGLANAPVRITLIDKQNHHLFQPLLYQVAIAGLLVIGVPFIGKLGLAAAIAVGAVVVSAITILPIMIDTLRAHLPRARELGVPEAMGLERGGYGLVTLHRPSNVDEPETLARLLLALARVARELPVVFPVHPRTRARLTDLGLAAAAAPLRLVEPQGYLEFLALSSGARLVLTDSGGLQEEATALGVPCLTLRENTERPITVTEGTNEVVGTDPDRIVRAALAALRDPRPPRCPALWDGRAGERAAEAVLALAASA